MPTYRKRILISEFAEPEIFFEYKGVKIYHTYTDNAETLSSLNFDRDCKSKRLFTTNKKCGMVPMFDVYFENDLRVWDKQSKNETRGVFNIQNIPNPKGHHITTHAGISRVLMEAIDTGWIKTNKTPECIHDCHILAHPK